MKRLEIKVQMLGVGGSEKITVPSNYVREYPFVTIVNMTDNSACLYPSDINSPTAGMSILCVGLYAAISFPMLPEMQNGFNVVYTNPMGTNLNTIKTCRLIFSDENLVMNQSYVSGFDLSENPTTPHIFNVPMTLANTEYNQLLPSGTKKISASIQTNDAAFRLAYRTGLVATPTAPFLTIPTAGEYTEKTIYLSVQSLFFACSGPGKIMQIMAWT